MRLHRVRYYLWLVVLLSGFLPEGRADIQITKIGDSVVDAKALTIKGGFGQAINGLAFQQDAVVTHLDHQYVAYYDAGRRVCLARRRLPAGDWQVVRFEDYAFKSNDSHNTISLGICPKDGTIHLAFDHHVHPLHYRVSQKGAAANPQGVAWEASLFGLITSELEKGRPIAITYPRFWQTPDGGLQFCYRQGGSGNGDRMLVDYSAETGTWIDTRQIDSRAGLFQDAMGKSASRCSYPNGYDYGPRGNLHATWVWRESSQGANHDLIYCYSQDWGKTWRNNRGEPLPGPPSVGSPGIKIVDISRAHGLMNTHGQAVDSQGRIHAVMWHCTDQSLQAVGSKPGQHRWGPPEARRYHHYWRDGDAVWHHIELPMVAGNRPKLFLDKEDNAYLVYCDAWRRGIFFLDGKLIIAAATADSRWKDWKIIHTEKGPFLNEMLGDVYRWKSKGVLSVMVQESPKEVHQPTALRVIDFVLCTSIASATETKYRDGRPAATLRMDAKDHGIVLRYGDGPDKCDILGARDVCVFEADGTYYMHYDAAGPRGWLCSLAVSKDLVTWEKKGPILDFGKPGEDDSKSASYGVTYYDGKQWHMFYLGTPNVSGPPNLVPSFPYLTMKAKGSSAAGPWIKQKNVVPFRTKPDTYYSVTASPGQIIRSGDEFLQFFSATTRKSGNRCVQRTLGIARTKDLDGPWTVDPRPMVPIEEQIENSSLYYEKSIKTWFLFTNHIGIDDGEYTDAIWVYWSKDPNKWDPRDKAVVLDGQNCTWSQKCIGLPSVVQVGKRLALLYDAPQGNSTSHMKRHIGLAWLDLPLSPPTGNAEDGAEQNNSSDSE